MLLYKSDELQLGTATESVSNRSITSFLISSTKQMETQSFHNMGRSSPFCGLQHRYINSTDLTHL